MSVQKVWIEEGCTLCELCVSTCPGVFRMGDDSAEVIGNADLTAEKECIKEAAELCPAEVIHFSE